MQEAELGESLKQSTREQKNLHFSPILIKNSRLGEVVSLCINPMCCNFRLCYCQLMFVCWEFRINRDETEMGSIDVGCNVFLCFWDEWNEAFGYKVIGYGLILSGCDSNMFKTCSCGCLLKWSAW